jgi:hypothetical protein
MQGEHVPLMYRDQRNHICINKDQRKHFRGAAAVLKIEAYVELFGTFSDGGTYGSYPSPYDLAMKFEGRVNAWLKDILTREGEQLRIVYQYELHVDAENLQGDFYGVYRNRSGCKSAVIRRIKRMVGPGLVIEDNTIRSRRKLLLNWKREQFKDAWAYYQERVREFKEKQKQQEQLPSQSEGLDLRGQDVSQAVN